MDAGAGQVPDLREVDSWVDMPPHADWNRWTLARTAAHHYQCSAVPDLFKQPRCMEQLSDLSSLVMNPPAETETIVVKRRSRRRAP